VDGWKKTTPLRRDRIAAALYILYTFCVFRYCPMHAFNEIHLLFKERISYALNGTTRKLSFSYDNICNEATLISLLMVKKKNL
jgi:hypothetical protein